jgi:hypothetical protein
VLKVLLVPQDQQVLLDFKADREYKVRKVLKVLLE